MCAFHRLVLLRNLQVVQREAGTGSIHWVVCQCNTYKNPFTKQNNLVLNNNNHDRRLMQNTHHNLLILLMLCWLCLYHKQQGCPWMKVSLHAGWRCWGHSKMLACCGSLCCYTEPRYKRWLCKRFTILSLFSSDLVPVLPEQISVLLSCAPLEVFFFQGMQELISGCFPQLNHRICCKVNVWKKQWKYVFLCLQYDCWYCFCLKNFHHNLFILFVKYSSKERA